MPHVDVIRFGQFIQYTGSNGPEVAAWLGQPILSDNGSRLVLGSSMSDPSVVLHATEWIWSNADFTAQWIKKTALAGVPDGVGTMDAVSVAVPLLVLGASVERVVTWNRPFSNANYKVSFVPDANTIGKITPTIKANTKTATGLTVTISAGLALTVAGVLHVIGTT